MKHAFLIIAHNEVPLLERLVSFLDDERNDIYVHWDAKAGSIPSLSITKSHLRFIDNRVEVNWAGYSMV